MKMLVTAGNTQIPIDKVRCITNVFTGRTGTRIALEALRRNHEVTLLTSHPEVVAELTEGAAPPAERWRVQPYRTFDDLAGLMSREIPTGGYEAIIHSAAVSDFLCTGAFAPSESSHFDFDKVIGHWRHPEGRPQMMDIAAGKVKSDVPELWLRFERAPKLIDRIRTDWAFRGVLVKFKLEVGVTEERLLEIAERSRQQSRADLMAANTLEGASEWAYLGPLQGTYHRLTRAELAPRLLEAIEDLQRERHHG